MKDFRNIWDHPSCLNLKGYPCLDPFIIIGNAVKREQANKTIISWLFAHSSWLARTIMGDMDNAVAMPSPQDWHDFLMKVGRQTEVDVAQSNDRQNPSQKRAYAGVVENLLENVPDFHGPVDVY
jgi:hypothetical protein